MLFPCKNLIVFLVYTGGLSVSFGVQMFIVSYCNVMRVVWRRLQTTAPPISPIWTTVDPWRPPSGAQSASVAPGMGPVMAVPAGSTQVYQAVTPMMMSAYGFGAAGGAAAVPVVRQTPAGPPVPFNSSPWPAPPQHQVPTLHGLTVNYW